MQAHRDVRQVGGLLGLLPQPRLCAGVGEDMTALGGADVGGDRDNGHTCHQTSGDRQHGRRSWSGQHGHLVSVGDPLGHRRCRADEITAAQHGAVDAYRVANVGAACDGGGVERVEQHNREVTHIALGNTGRVDWIQTVATREIYRNSWLTLREDDIRRPDGSSGIYAVVDKPTYALVIARDGDRFHLVEQYRYPLGLRRWEFPQGAAPGLENSEPMELAERELREETGLRAEAMTLLGQLDVAPGMSSQRGWVFVATGITEGEHDREHEEQDMHSAWFSRAEVERMMRDGEITDAQSIAAFALLLLSER